MSLKRSPAFVATTLRRAIYNYVLNYGSATYLQKGMDDGALLPPLEQLLGRSPISLLAVRLKQPEVSI